MADGGDEAVHRGGDAVDGPIGHGVVQGKAGHAFRCNADVLTPTIKLNRTARIDMDFVEKRRSPGPVQDHEGHMAHPADLPKQGNRPEDAAPLRFLPGHGSSDPP